MLTREIITDLRKSIETVDGTGRHHVPVDVRVLEHLARAAEQAMPSDQSGHAIWLHYVRHADVAAYKRLGWEIDSRFGDGHHHEFSVLMSFYCEGDPPKPEGR